MFNNCRDIGIRPAAGIGPRKLHMSEIFDCIYCEYLLGDMPLMMSLQYHYFVLHISHMFRFIYLIYVGHILLCYVIAGSVSRTNQNSENL